MIERTKENIRKYDAQKMQASVRGIEWLFDHDTWFDWWDKTGLWEQRGPFRNQYVMARFNDSGPYAPWNVKCITCSENIREHMIGQTKALGCIRSAETLQRMSAALKDKPFTPEHLANVSAAQKLRWQNYRLSRIAHLERVPNDTSCVTRKPFARNTQDDESVGLATIRAYHEQETQFKEWLTALR